MQPQVDLETAQNFCNTATQLKSQGKYNEAIASYQKALEIQPDYPEVQHHLAEIYFQQKKLPEAAASCKLALKLQPDFAAAYKTLGNILQSEGKIPEALRAYSKALDINPDFAEAWVNKGTMLSKQGQPEEAIACYRKAIDIKPDLVAAHWNLGNLFMQQGRADEAVPCWQKALELKPELLSAETLNDLGTTLGKQGKFQEAIESYQRAVQLKPDYALAHFNLGMLLKQEGEIEQSLAHLHKASQLNPDNAEAYNQIGSILAQQNRCEEALVYYQKLLKLLPDSGLGYFNIGAVLAQQNRFEKAIPYFQKAIDLQPNLSEAYCNIGVLVHRQNQIEGNFDPEKFKYALNVLQKAIEIKSDLLLPHLCLSYLIGAPTHSSNFPSLREAADNYLQNSGENGKLISAITYINTYVRSGLNQIAKDKFLEIEPEIYNRLDELKMEEITLVYSQIVFNVNYFRDDLEANTKLAKTIGKKYVEKVINANPNQIINAQLKSERSHPLKIGFLSSYFNRHSVGWCSYDAIRELSNITPEVYLYSTSDRKRDDRMKLFEQACKKFYKPKSFPNGLVNPQEILDEVLKDDLDILIDLDSLTVPAQVEIIHRKPAPVCLTWLGFEAPFTDESNYFLCDWHTHPNGREKYYSEQLIRLPDSFVAVSGFECSSGEREAIRKGMRISEDQVVYLCVAPAYKLNPDLIRSQVKIIKNVPDSVLLYKGHTGDTEVIKAAYQKEFKEAGIGLQRLKFLPLFKTEEEHRIVYKIADVLLDSYPYNGGTHNLEALWFNLPIVTRSGEQYLSRMGYSFLQAVSLSEGVAKSWEEYSDWGIQLGNNTELRLSVRDKLVQSKQPETLSPLWNPKKLARDMYGVFEQLLAKQVSEVNS